MVTATIHMKSGKIVNVTELERINLFNAGTHATYEASDASSMPLNKRNQYVFVGARTSVSVLGNEISCLEFTKG